MVTIIIPIIYYGPFAVKAINCLTSKIEMYNNICFVFVCSCSDVFKQTLSILKRDSNTPKCSIINAGDKSSNHLRKIALDYVKTEFVYYQDCDDIVDYELIDEMVPTLDTNNVYSFNIYRKVYDYNGNVIDEGALFNIPESLPLSIEQMPTNVVNKIIPASVIRKVSFFDLPYSQDWSISFQLYKNAPHYYINKFVYRYENNPFSSSGLKKTKYSTTLRVCVMDRFFQEFYKNNEKERVYLMYRYGLLLEERFSYLGIPYFPKYRLGMFSLRYFGVKEVIKHLCHLVLSLINISYSFPKHRLMAVKKF